MKTYPTIKVKNNQTQEVEMGWLIGTDLVVIKATRTTYEIWNSKGTTLFRNILGEQDAVALAEWLDTTYKEYFLVWKEYPEIDLFRISMWTVKDGTKLFEVIEALRISAEITWALVRQLYRTATGKKYYQWYMAETRI